MISAIVGVLLLKGSMAGQDSMIGKTVPSLVGKEWLNADKPITWADRKGKVTIVHFWTFACSNCKNNLGPVKRLLDSFSKEGVEVLSIHTPELPEERSVENVKKAVEKYAIKYPVLIDGEFKNWKAWKVQYWPTVFVVDKKLKVRSGWVGELNYQDGGGEAKIAEVVTQLLAEK
jgi:peroxiredoxin